MDTLLKLVQTANAYLSDYILIVMLVGCGLYYSIRTRFVQVRCLGEGMRRVFGGFSLRGGKQSGGISSFQALATAVAAQVGTGNIVGACGAILVGGPGVHVLDVAHRLLRHGHHLLRSRPGAGDSCCGRRWQRGGRPRLLHPPCL